MVNVPQSVVDDSHAGSSQAREGSSIVLPSVPASLVPFLPPVSSCPPFLLRKDEHALGVAFWAVPLLFRHSSAIFSQQQQQRRRSMRRPTQQQPQSSGEGEQLLRCTRTLLLINPDNATAWNARKWLLSACCSSPSPASSLSLPASAAVSLSAELRFLSFVFSKHPKSSEAWAHRRWAGQRLMEAVHGDTDALLALLRAELAVVELTAERYPKNYHAWLHRQWLVQAVDGQLSKQAETDSGRGGQGWVDVLEKERQRIGAWNESHMSDHSGWHYRSFVIDRLLACCSSPTAPPALLTDELSYLSSLQQLYPAHESAWSYRRYVLHSALLCYSDSEEWRQRWRRGEDEWCDEREAAGHCSSEDEWRLEKRYARVHRLYVTELLVRAEQQGVAAAAKERTVEDALRGMRDPHRARWLCDVAGVQQVYPRQVWADRVAFVT